MSNIDDKQKEIEEKIKSDAKSEDLIIEINKIKNTINYILELMKTRNF